MCEMYTHTHVRELNDLNPFLVVRSCNTYTYRTHMFTVCAYACAMMRPDSDVLRSAVIFARRYNVSSAGGGGNIQKSNRERNRFSVDLFFTIRTSHNIGLFDLFA